TCTRSRRRRGSSHAALCPAAGRWYGRSPSPGPGCVGVVCEERPDGFAIEGRPDRPFAPGRVHADGEHPIAKAAAGAGPAYGPTIVAAADNVATSYPGFGSALAALGAQLRVEQRRPPGKDRGSSRKAPGAARLSAGCRHRQIYGSMSRSRAPVVTDRLLF